MRKISVIGTGRVAYHFINEILSKKNKKIIIIISHKLKVVNKCDRLVNFNEGKMFNNNK